MTGYDDNTSTGETVSFNSSVVGGPIDQNLGMNASLLQISTSSISGSNTLSITSGPTPVDHLGWMIAAIRETPAPTGTGTTTWGRIKALYR